MFAQRGYIKYSVDEYLKLYQVCGSFAAKESELFLRWLGLLLVRRKKQKRQDFGSGFYETQQSVIAIVLNSIHCGVRQEMASTISNDHYGIMMLSFRIVQLCIEFVAGH